MSTKAYFNLEGQIVGPLSKDRILLFTGGNDTWFAQILPNGERGRFLNDEVSDGQIPLDAIEFVKRTAHALAVHTPHCITPDGLRAHKSKLMEAIGKALAIDVQDHLPKADPGDKKHAPTLRHMPGWPHL